MKIFLFTVIFSIAFLFADSGKNLIETVNFDQPFSIESVINNADTFLNSEATINVNRHEVPFTGYGNVCTKVSVKENIFAEKYERSLHRDNLFRNVYRQGTG